MSLTFARVKGHSMSPLIEEGDLIAFKSQTHKLGDIITFKSNNNTLITHRLIGEKNGLITKGDNVPFLDSNINTKDILGVAQFVLKKDSFQLFHLTRKADNNRFLNYSILEINTINSIKKIYSSKYVNYFVKHLYSPLYFYNYLLHKILCKNG